MSEAAIRSTRSDHGLEPVSLDQEYEPRRFAALIVVGVIALGVWLAVVTSLAPARLLTYVAFFTPLWVAVAALSSAAIYRMAGADGEPRPHLLRSSFRRGLLFASFVVANMALVAGKRWTPVLCLVIVGICMVVELTVWGRHHSWRDP